MGYLRLPGFVRRYLSLITFIVFLIWVLRQHSHEHSRTSEAPTSMQSRILSRVGAGVGLRTARANDSGMLPRPRTRPLPLPIRKPIEVMEEVEDEVEEVEEVEDREDNTPKVHTYRPDGLLEVNPKAPHPIFELIARAEASWDEKLRSASKNLDEAVAEYKRRYKRSPPLGFDKWWEYVEKHNVQLPDEYDQIYRDLEPFWGANPVDLQRAQSDWEGHLDTYTIGKVPGGAMGLLNSSFSRHFTAADRDTLLSDGFVIMDLLRDVEQHLLPFRAVFSPHDNPEHLRDFEFNESALKAARDGTHLDARQPPEPKLAGWISACHSSSTAVRTFVTTSSEDPDEEPIYNEAGFDSKKRENTKSFVYDHRIAMDPCHHPSILQLHGQFLTWAKGPTPPTRLIPSFSYSPTMLHTDIMFPTLRAWVDDAVVAKGDLPWENKYDERLQWRGRNTGIWHAEDTPWEKSHRGRVVQWANNDLERNFSLLVPPSQGADGLYLSKVTRSGTKNPVPVPKSLYSPKLFDISFADGAIQCTPQICKKLRTLFQFKNYMGKGSVGQYKYILDIDGNGWSSRFKRLISSKSLIFKSTIYPEWWLDRIQPWVHYVPVQIDYSDLLDALVFFRGDLDGQGRHDELARKIGLAGHEWSKTFWRKEDLTAYMFRLFLEYARVMSPIRDVLSFDL